MCFLKECLFVILSGLDFRGRLTQVKPGVVGVLVCNLVIQRGC